MKTFVKKYIFIPAIIPSFKIFSAGVPSAIESLVICIAEFASPLIIALPKAFKSAIFIKFS